jgi:hypothetical protein
MKDPAVAAVVGVMLILVIVVSLLAVLNTTTIPDLKAQAEVGHVREVEEGFARLSAALSGISSGPSGSGGTFAIPLGGGEVPMNTLRSSGTLFVMNDTVGSPAVEVTLNGMTFPVRFVTVGYRPTVHFWVDQGYNWSLGYVMVTKAGIETPLDYFNESHLAESGHWERFRRVILSDENHGENGTLSRLTISLTSFEPGNQTFTSGNGVGSIRYSVHDEPGQTFQPASLDIRVNQTLPGGLKDQLDDYLASIKGTYANVNSTLGADGNYSFSFTGDLPNVTVNRRVVSLSAG